MNGPPEDSPLPPAPLEVPEFPDGLRWVNRRERLRLADLRGVLVALLFWNGHSASSSNLIGELRELQKRIPDAFTLVCIHTPRHACQQSDAAVLKAAHRHHLHAAVANDAQWLAWRRFAIAAWPTLLLIDSRGKLAARLVGEGRIEEIEDAIVQLGEPGLARVEAAVALDRRAEPVGPLSFPAHVLAAGNRVYVSDTGHHRILECTHGGRVLRQFGSGTPGNWDGQLAACGFQAPHGLACDAATLYVADTGNHCVRRIRLETGEVDTVLGAGHASRAPVEQPGSGPRVAINAPRAVAVDGNMLYVAATGQHQILRVNLQAQRVEVLAGDGRSDVRDGIGGQSSLSQPAALALLPGQLLIADTGGNAVRRLRLADLALTTLAGSSPWQPGNLDGIGANARFVYPSGLAAIRDRVFIADTGNARLCTLDPYSGEVASLQFDYPLHEPQGMSCWGRTLWLADCNDHAILRIDPEAGTCERIAVGE
jgi:hypothetical protein